MSREKELVFIGGGHAHALVIREFGIKPIPDVRITLISEQTLTPYSGMLPGFVAGHYDYLDAHIDLDKLCRWANVRFIRATVTGINADSNTIEVDSGGIYSYDQLSIDIGSTPDLSVPGAREFAVGVKPVSHFGKVWNTLLEVSEFGQGDWGVIGAGAGGVELVLGMAHRFKDNKALRFHLLFANERVLPDYPDKLASIAEDALANSNVTLHPNFRVAKVERDGLISTDKHKVILDKSIWCTGAVAASWLADTGLAVSPRGFIAVNQYLQSLSHQNVFAAGDCCDMVADPRPKAGVYAVRQAPYLAKNLRSVLIGKEQDLKPLLLQKDFLSLLSLGRKTAVGCRMGYTFAGDWVWRLKNYIDQKFMNQLQK